MCEGDDQSTGEDLPDTILITIGVVKTEFFNIPKLLGELRSKGIIKAIRAAMAAKKASDMSRGE